MKKIIAAVVLAAAIAGCGGSSLPKDVTGAPTLQAAAAALGCTGLKPMSPPTMLASAEGFWRYQGRTADLATFATNKIRDNWEKIATNFAPLIKNGNCCSAAHTPCPPSP